MSDPRVDALAGELLVGPKLAAKALTAADAADLLPPKMRALIEAAEAYIVASEANRNEALIHLDYALHAFTAEDLVRLGITEPVTS